ncbi:MAG: Lrp/AsnC family transcriptional regulator [Bacteroidetes bacterium]|nr:Lrp/AsnC family transcriptional regulator [Bacteroidota bacterium]
MPKLDKTDYKILKVLQEDAKITNLGLSKKIGLSPAPTLERVRKLEQAKALGLGVSCFITVSLSKHHDNNIESFLHKVTAMEEVVECHHITGSADYLLKVITEDIGEFELFLSKKLTGMVEVSHMETSVVLSTLKESKVLTFMYDG